MFELVFAFLFMLALVAAMAGVSFGRAPSPAPAGLEGRWRGHQAFGQRSQPLCGKPR